MLVTGYWIIDKIKYFLSVLFSPKSTENKSFEMIKDKPREDKCSADENPIYEFVFVKTYKPNSFVNERRNK
jgi:hypothetical protein